MLGVAQLERLRRARQLLTVRGMNTRDCRLACFSAAGFSDALRKEAEREDVVLVGLKELYGVG